VAPTRTHPDDREAVVTGNGAAPAIRTPDQRLRVFVSSTLRELEPERRAARNAIERMRLAPVMFELGARPHPPRDLYRAYLEQSDVFVGLYWQQYGWVAPGEEVSGLEDEYRLAPRAMPKLIYVKQPAERNERLDGLIARIRDDDTTSYKAFSTAAELEQLIEADLATLLAERFDASRAFAEPSTTEDAHSGRLPAPPADVVGREQEISTLLAWLGDGTRRLITLTGPGGIGKSRLVIEVAGLARDRFDRVTFVALEHVRDSESVLPAIARALGVREGGELPMAELLGMARAGRRDLLVLDNFEQILAAAPLLASLLTELPGATILVTSRARLRVRGEHVFDVEPLTVLRDPATAFLEEILTMPSVQLFRERAQAADPRFEVTSENAEQVASICRALDGVPLAIELAAARIRALTPGTMLAKLDRVLPLLVTAARDVPERQRTIQATVEWSIRLLSDDAQTLFSLLGVFVGDFSLDAVEAIAGGEPWAADPLGPLLELVDGSLLRQHDVQGVPFFSMLAPVREVATVRFEGDRNPTAARRMHAEHYVRVAGEAEPLLQGATQLTALTRLEAEKDNLRAGYRYLISVGEVDTVADAVWSLLLYWWIRNLLPEARAWMEDILAAGVPLTNRTRAIALAFSSWVALSQPGTLVDPGPVEESVELFHAAGDDFGEACALTVLSIAYLSASTAELDRAEEAQRRAIELSGTYPSFRALFSGALGSVQLVRGRASEALATFDAVIEEAVRLGDRFIESITLTNAGWARLALGEARPDLFVQHLRLSLHMGNEDGIGYAFEGLAACAALVGDADAAGLLLGAAETARKRTGMIEQRSYVILLRPLVERIIATDQAAGFEAARARGRALSRREALDMALGRAPAEAERSG
jgi:predicted ATPase